MPSNPQRVVDRNGRVIRVLSDHEEVYLSAMLPEPGELERLLDNASDTPEIELALPARAENIAVVRHAFDVLGEALELRKETLSAIRLAVTEACTNVVLHAYDEDSDGSLTVRAVIGDGRLVVTVRDRGRGLTPRPDSPGLGVGLPLIARLSESLELKSVSGRETEVQMTFVLSATAAAAYET